MLPYSTRDSRIVPNCSTDRAQRCLTSQFGWDAVLSSWYDRKTSAVRPGAAYTKMVVDLFNNEKRNR